jgi:5-methyltetrahydrofolate--homocysteine methyltransferase
MATVKGDVHDIGKNIVGVVLACNNYEVIDLGVMVPARRSWRRRSARRSTSSALRPDHAVARRDGARRRRDGARGLRHAAADRRRHDLRVHTAVKIAPRYNAQPGVSRARRLARRRRRLGAAPSGRAGRDYVDVAAEYEVAIRVPAQSGTKQRVMRSPARANALQARTGRPTRRRSRLPGTRVFEEYPLPNSSPTSTGRRSSKMLDLIVREKWLTAKGVVAFWPCRREGDDVVIYSDETRTKEISRLYFLRQQIEKRAPRANMCLADFISPEADWIGGFAVTAGHGIEQHLARFKADHDDYSDILLKALADRLAEAFAERLHERVRKTLWGYAPEEALSNEELVREKYRGIRPAPGYPACPDHSQKPELFRLLNAGQNAGIQLTESFAMIPTSAVSGYYFAHPDAQYFGVARIGKDQVEDYAARRGVSLEQAERWLRPNIGY